MALKASCSLLTSGIRSSMPRFPMVPLDGGTLDQRMERERESERERWGGWRGCGAAILVQDTAVLVDVVESSSRALPRAKRGSDRLWKQRRGEREVQKGGI